MNAQAARIILDWSTLLLKIWTNLSLTAALDSVKHLVQNEHQKRMAGLREALSELQVRDNVQLPVLIS